MCYICLLGCFFTMWCHWCYSVPTLFLLCSFSSLLFSSLRIFASLHSSGENYSFLLLCLLYSHNWFIMAWFITCVICLRGKKIYQLYYVVVSHCYPSRLSRAFLFSLFICVVVYSQICSLYLVIYLPPAVNKLEKTERKRYLRKESNKNNKKRNTQGAELAKKQRKYLNIPKLLKMLKEKKAGTEPRAA